MVDKDQTVLIEDARIIFRNFTGKEGPYNRKGDRNFAVVLTPEAAEAMSEDGWNVKWLEARDEGEENTPYLPVEIKFKNRPPRITLLTSTGRTLLTEDSVEVVDALDIAKVDVICRPYFWEVQDKSGVKAYLQTMYITIHEDALDLKYAQKPNMPTED